MSTVEEIEAAIEKLPQPEFLRLKDWMLERIEDDWDRQFANDATSGKLDATAQEALAEHRAGRSEPFPPDEK
ncbi:MAG: hypothetical protein CMO74_04190 [Verrucomicrobiales bacterium]|nr:hypothetical protein [Verrucomicrobiales bacterium]|tara:strand:+ start:3696 stop:3911 length:216 start_codon:yes stop_codon:yes gene_type:complete